MRSSGSSTISGPGRPGGSEAHSRADSTRSCSALNHRSRSSHGTAAFAGEVDGERRAPSRRCVGSRRPSSGRPPNAPLYAAFPTKARTPGCYLTRERREPIGAPVKSAFRRSPEPPVVRQAAFVTPIPRGKLGELVLWLEETRREAAAWRRRQKSLRGIREQLARAVETPRVDPAEDDPHAGREHVGNGGRRRREAAMPLRARALRCAPRTRAGCAPSEPRSTRRPRAPGRTTFTASSAPRQP